MRLRAKICTLLLALFALTAPAWAAKVTVCHIPPGNPSNLNTITISEHALQAHLAHGDFLGDCAAAACPCMRIPQFNILLANANFCSGSAEDLFVSIDPFTSLPTAAFAETATAAEPICGIADFNTMASITLPVTPEQATICFQTVADAGASRGLNCFGG